MVAATDRLADQTWPTVRRGSTVLVPVGATEQHGPHLPLDTDSVIAAAVSVRVRDLLEESEDLGTLIAPTVTFGASGEHQSFPGTCSIGSDGLAFLLLELVRSMSTWAGRVVLINGHGGNVAALDRAVTQLVEEDRDVVWFSCSSGWVDAHAGYTETSLMLHLAPDRVRLDLAAVGNVRPLAELMPQMRKGGVAAVSSNGVLGDPRGADETEGRRVLELMARDIADRIQPCKAGKG